MILAHSELEAMYAYLGMVLQGEMIQALFTGLKPLVFLFLIIGIVWAIGSMMVRGRANAILLYILLAVASLVLLKQTMVADSQALITGKSGSTHCQCERRRKSEYDLLRSGPVLRCGSLQHDQHPRPWLWKKCRLCERAICLDQRNDVGHGSNDG